MCTVSGGHICFEKIEKFAIVRKFELCLHVYNIDAYVCSLE